MRADRKAVAPKFVIGLILTALLAGCGSKPSTTEAPKDAPLAAKQDAVIATVADLVQLDPLDIGDDPSSLVAQHVMEWLVNRDKDGNLVPGLASKWTTSPDGLTWTFDLRTGIKFHDGSDFNADVVKWQFDRIMKDETAPARFRKQWSDVIADVKVIDPAKLAVTLKAPNAAFLDLVITTNAGMIMSKANFEKLGAKEAALHPVGTGPFIFKEWLPGQRAVLTANPNYWGEKPKLSSLSFRPIPETNTQVIELETGGVHLISKIGLEDIDRLKANKDLRVETTPAYKVRFLTMNVGRAPLNDVKVRQAINYAVDVNTIITSLVGDMGVPTDLGALPLNSWGYPGAGKLPAYKQDVAKAKALLAEAGWVAGPDGKLTKDGKPLTLDFRSPNGRYFMDKEISEAIKNQLTKVGFDVNLQVMEWAPYVANAQKANYDLTLLGWNQGSPDPSVFFDPLVKTGGRGNYSKYSDPQIDAWLTDAVKEQDQAKRKELYAKAAQRVNENAWYVPLYNETKAAASRVELKGYVHTAAGDGLQGLYLTGKDN